MKTVENFKESDLQIFLPIVSVNTSITKNKIIGENGIGKTSVINIDLQQYNIFFAQNQVFSSTVGK